MFISILLVGTDVAFKKLSLYYMSFLFQYKIDQVALYFDDLLLDYALGSNKNIETMGGDFGWVYFILYYGLFGLLLFFIFILKNLNRSNFLPIILLVVSSFHYPTVFFFCGQVIFAYLLNIKKSYYLTD